jgi:hypothetical protein
MTSNEIASILLGVTLCLTSWGCGGDDDSSGGGPAATVTATATLPTPSETETSLPTPTPTATASVTPESCDDPGVQAREPLCELDQETTHCDFLNREKCLLPYPSSVFLHPDPTTPTGYRLNYSRQAMPANKDGVPIDPTEWNTLDGFGPGPIIEALFPQGVDLAASGVPPIDDFSRSLDSDSPTVLIDATTGEHIVHFVELDVQAANVATRAFLIRPGIRLKDATRYIVAIRGLVDLDGNAIAPERPFEILRDGVSTPVHTIEARREHFEDIFDALEQGGVARDDLILAWDFVTASRESLTGRALSLRDQGLQVNGPGAPPFEVTSVEDDVNEDTFRRVRGTFTVPLFMDSATPPAFFNLDENGVPVQNGTATAPFIVNIPRIAVEAGTAARPIVYGHGLLGSGDEVNAGHLQDFANQYGFIVAGTDWIGMAEGDVGPTLAFIQDLSGFPALPDRLQQAMLNFMLLGRLMTAPDGFNSDPAFQVGGRPLIDTQELYFYGISQGGIAGGVFMALSTETIRGVLGVGAANYSTLLQRSVDFDTFEVLLRQAYPDELDRTLLLPIIQQLWDRADPQAYENHLVSDPLPGTPAKKLLLQPGVYDSQVANIGTEIQVRSMGIPALAPSVLPLFQVPEMEAPFDGSAFVPYDVNAVPAPTTNTPPAEDNGVHEAVRRLNAARRQIDAFLRPDGMIRNYCNGPCFFRDVPGVDER